MEEKFCVPEEEKAEKYCQLNIFDYTLSINKAAYCGLLFYLFAVPV